MSLISIQKQFKDEATCHAYLAEKRWPTGRYCPYCGSLKSYAFSDGKTYKCADCRRRFTATIGSIFEGSHIPLQKWFMATYLVMSHKKGVSSIQVAKDLELTQKSAWFMLQRIRYAVGSGSFDKPLDGTAENDETYYGGKGPSSKERFSNKMAIIGMVEKHKGAGQLRTKAVRHADVNNITSFVRKNLKPGSVLHTDESYLYGVVKNEYEHDFVTHSHKEYVRKDGVGTNQIEGLWYHLKASLDTIYMHVSHKHLQRYCDEFSWRYSTRDISDNERFELWFSRVNGKRLTYRRLKSGAY